MLACCKIDLLDSSFLQFFSIAPKAGIPAKLDTNHAGNSDQANANQNEDPRIDEENDEQDEEADVVDVDDEPNENSNGSNDGSEDTPDENPASGELTTPPNPAQNVIDVDDNQEAEKEDEEMKDENESSQKDSSSEKDESESSEQSDDRSNDHKNKSEEKNSLLEDAHPAMDVDKSESSENQKLEDEDKSEDDDNEEKVSLFFFPLTLCRMIRALQKKKATRRMKI
jgi:type IV secretory pathway VirB10-like protein